MASCALGGVVGFDAGCKTNNISSSGEDVTQVIGPNGGIVHFDDQTVSVSIPPGALSQNTEVHLHTASTGYPPLPAGTPVGTLVYALEPFGTITATQFQVSIVGGGTVDRADPVTNWAPLQTENAGGQAIGHSSAFGYFVLASGSGSKTVGDDAGTTSGGDGGQTGGGNSGDGTVVASNLTGVATQSGFACDDAFAYYFSTYQDPLNGTVNQLMAVPVTGGGAPVKISQAQGFSGLAASNGAVYWIENGANGMGYTLKSATAPSFAAQTITTWSGSGSPYSNNLSAYGDNLWMLEGQTLHRYDTKANMLDSMAYGQIKQSPMATTFAATATGVMYFGGSTNYTVYTAAPGSAPVTSGASVPGSASIVAFGADGTNAVFGASGNGMTVIYALDATSASATPKQLASLSSAGGGGGANGFVVNGGYIFTTLGPSGAATEPITRYSVADGSSSVVGHYLSQGMTGKPLVVTASSVYVLENNPAGGGQIEKWARP